MFKIKSYKGKVMKKYCMPFLLLLCGCSFINSKLPENPPTQQEQACSEIRRNIVFNATSNASFSSSSPTQQAEMMRLYDKNNCDKILKNN
jgi:hypothetical protein